MTVTPSFAASASSSASNSVRRMQTPIGASVSPTTSPMMTRTPRIGAAGTVGTIPIASSTSSPSWLTAPAHGLSRGNFALSTIRIRAGSTPSLRTKWSAVLEPAGPPPTIAISVFTAFT